MKLSEKIQEALREQQEINLSDPAVQKRLAAQWGYVPAEAQPASIKMSITTKALSKMFLGLDGLDKAQPGYEWSKGWNDAIRQAMNYAQPTPSVPECPYPCGWRNLLKLAIEDGAYLARNINEDEPVTENARSVTMRMVTRLRDVLMVVNNAAPEAKP